MDKASFYHLLDLIREHLMFQSNSNCEQAQVEAQLAVCLDRLGDDGNNVLKDYIQQPTRGERELNSQAFGRLGFPGCVGLIDGSLSPLS